MKNPYRKLNSICSQHNCTFKAENLVVSGGSQGNIELVCANGVEKRKMLISRLSQFY